MQRISHTVRAADGVRIAFDLYTEAGRETVVVICPGFFQSKQAPTFQRLARTLAQTRDVICLDFRGHGRSGGWYTFSAREPADVAAVVAWAVRRYRRLGLLGFSLGAAVAVAVAGQVREIQSVIAVSTPLTFEEIECRWWTPRAIRTGWEGLEPGAGVRPGQPWLRKVRPREVIQALAPTPLLLVHGMRDPIIHSRHSAQLYARAGEPKRLELIEGGGHAEQLYRRCPARFLAVIEEWLTLTLAESGEQTPGLQHARGYVTSARGVDLSYQRWVPEGARVPVVIVHGGGEHSGRYGEAARRLAAHGMAVHAFDLSGHGRSPGIRGHIRRFDDYLVDLASVIQALAQQHPGQPPILLGHSLGGLISTYYAIGSPETIHGLILTSPLWGLSLPVPWWKRAAAWVLSACWPACTMARERGEDLLSHDPDVGARYVADPLVHVRISGRLYQELLGRFRTLPADLRHLRVPVLVLQAGDDRIASTEVTRGLFPCVASPQKTLIVYEGYYHEVLNETGKDAVFHDLVRWVNGVLAPRVRGAGG